MSTLRVAVIGPARFPLAEPFAGGLEAHTHALVTGLRRRGHDVTVFAAPGSDRVLGATDLALQAYQASTAARADVAAPPQRWMSEHHAYLQLMLQLASPGSRYDVVHDNSLHHLPVAMAASLAAPVVTTLHTPPVPWLESAALLADPRHRFVTVSSTMAEAWRHAVDADVVANGVDVERWAPGPGGRRALWSGRIVPEKAPHAAVRAARQAGLPIDLVGPVLDRPYFDAEVRPLLSSEVRYLGHLPQRSLRHVAAHAKVVLVTPRWDEPFGLVAAEALSCGTPVAAWARGALTEIVDESVGALAEPDDLDALVDAVRRAAGRDRRRAREHAERHFSLDAMLDGYEKVYDHAAADRLVA